jgi:hypothetical protein
MESDIYCKLNFVLGADIMRKLLLVMVSVVSLSYATDDCSQIATKVVNKLKAHNLTAVKLSYSSDNVNKAKACQKAITAQDPNLTVNMSPVSGSGQFKFSRP